MATESMTALEQLLRARVLAFVPLVNGAPGPSLGAALGTRCYLDAPPDDVAYPYGVQTVRLREGGSDGHARLAGDYQLMLYGRPRKLAADVRVMGDVAVQALLNFATTSGGVVVVTGAQAQAVPPPPEPIDRELVAVLVSATLYAWPQFLTQYLT